MEFKTIEDVEKHPLYSAAWAVMKHVSIPTLRAIKRGTKIPVIPDLHLRTLAALEEGNGELDMSWFHWDAYSDAGSYAEFCGTTHCRAGWATHFAGDRGWALEKELGYAAAAMLIVLASCPWLDRVPDFYCGRDEALAEIKRLAAMELALEDGEGERS